MLSPAWRRSAISIPFFLRHEPRADPSHGQSLQRRHEAHDLTMAVRLVATRPVVGGGPRHTDLAGRGEDAPPSSPLLHERLTFGRQRTPPRPLLDTTKRRQHSLQTLGGVATAAGNRLADSWSIFSCR